MIRLLRGAFAAAVALLCISQPARAADYFQVPFGIKRGTTPSPVCITTGGDLCLGQFATLNTGTGALNLVATGGVASIFPSGGQATLQLGLPSIATTPFIDFHAGAGNAGYDARLTATTGGSSNGSGTLGLNGTLSVVPVPGSVQLGYFGSQSLSGTTTANCQSGAFQFPCVNLWQISSDDADASSPTNALDGWQFAHHVSGNTKGARQAVDQVLNFTGASNAGSTNDNFVASVSQTNVFTGDGGTGVTVPTARGSFYAGNDVVRVLAASTNLLSATGREIDVSMAGSSVTRLGLSVVSFPGNNAALTKWDAAINIGAVTGAFNVSWVNGIILSGLNGGAVPIAPVTGCGFCSDGTAWTMTDLINFSSVTISGSALKTATANLSGAGGLGIGTATAPSAGIVNVTSGYQVAGAALAFSNIAGQITLAQEPTLATNTILGNATSGSAVPTALAIGTCSAASSALTWTTNTGFGCNTLVAGVANPTASVGLTAVNGSAATAMRSDGAPALSQAIVPTWTGIHTFSAAPVFSLGAKYSGSSSGTVTVLASATAGTPTITWGNASGTPAVTASAPLALSTTTGNLTLTGAAGQVLAGSTPAFTATPTLGVAGSTVGSLALANATSGSVTLQPVTGALGSAVLSLPATTSTVAVTGNNLGVFAATTSAQLAGVISDETGSGALVFATSPTLVTPTLGVASATSINKLTITAPATSATLTIADGASLITSGAFATTITATAATNSTLPSGTHTLAGLDVAQTFTVAQVVQAATSIPLTVRSTGATNSYIAIDNVAGGNQSGLNFQDASAQKWQFIKQADNSFQIFDAVGSTTILAAVINNGTLSLTPANNLILAPSGAHGVSVGSAADPGTGNLSVSGIYKVGASSGLSTTKTVRASGGAADCTLIYTGGILTGGSC